MILDATAGNRTIWRKKDSDLVIYMDMEKKLTIKPTIFADNTQIPFIDGCCDNVFFDPPHAYGVYTGRHVHPSIVAAAEKGVDKSMVSAYYGWDKYKTQMALLNYVFKAQKEFKRILKCDGLLWLKWNEVCVHIGTVLHLFEDWIEMMRIEIAREVHPAGTRSTYWICMCKKKRRDMQLRLS